jgi:ACS family hexuronate transporter-like MFS transporter
LLTRRQSWTIAIVATLTMTVSYVDRQTLAVLGPTVSKALGISDQQFGWLGSAFALAYLFATPLSGWWIDRTGARRGLATSVLVWTTVAALHALVPGFGVLFVMRIALGFAEGPGFPGGAQTIHRVLPPEDRPRGFGLLFTGSSIGGMLVPLLATFLFTIGGWRFAFLGTALAGLLWLPAWLYVTRSPEVRTLLAPSKEPAANARMSWREVATNVHMRRAWCAVLASAPIPGFGLLWGSKFLVRSFQLQQVDVGHYLWLPPLFFDAGAVIFGDLAARTKKPRPLFAIATLLGLSFVGLAYASTPWQAVTVLGLAMAGAGAIYTLTLAEIMAHTPPQFVSFAGGTVAGAQSVILIITSPLIGASIDHWHSYSVAIVATTLWLIPGALLWLVMKPKSSP